MACWVYVCAFEEGRFNTRRAHTHSTRAACISRDARARAKQHHTPEQAVKMREIITTATIGGIAFNPACGREQMAAAAARSGDVCLFTDRAASYLPVDCTQHCLFGYGTAVLENKEIYILIKYDVDYDVDDDDGGNGQSSGRGGGGVEKYDPY